METSTSVSLVARLAETHVSTSVMLSQDSSDFSLGRCKGEPGGAYDAQLLRGGTCPWRGVIKDTRPNWKPRHTHTHTHTHTATCVLRKSQGAICTRDIKRRVEQRLALWIAGNYDTIVQDIVGEAKRGVGGGRGTIDKDLVA
jgi:hypothetical protein